MLNVNMTRQFT